MTPALLVDGVSKTFDVPQETRHTLKERVLHPVRRTHVERFKALDDVSFAVEPGEFFGIVGRNGSGKSTMLKCLAGIYRTDRGAIYVNGRMSPFIELGVGFNPDLAARDNVIMNAIMLGLTPREAAERFEQVIAFAELEDFVDLKIKNYSSGMLVRLAFSVMIEVDAEILLIDEVLAVGDAAFQQKCFDVFNRMRDEGRTILLVTHDMGASVTRFCHRALLLEHGRTVALGDPQEVADRYLALNFDRRAAAPAEAADGSTATGSSRSGDGRARVLDAWIEGEGGEREESFMQGTRCTFRARVRFEAEAQDPIFLVVFANEQHQPVLAAASDSVGHSGRFEAGSTATFSIAFDNVLAPGRYDVSTVLARAGGVEVMDKWERLLSFVVASIYRSGGLVDLPYEVGIEREGVEQRTA